MKREKAVDILGWIATVFCICMYVSYIPQIIQNFQGNPVSPLQPTVAAINATFWCLYGFFKEDRDWAIIISNLPGIIFGLFTLITVYIH